MVVEDPSPAIDDPVDVGLDVATDVAVGASDVDVGVPIGRRDGPGDAVVAGASDNEIGGAAKVVLAAGSGADVDVGDSEEGRLAGGV